MIVGACECLRVSLGAFAVLLRWLKAVGSDLKTLHVIYAFISLPPLVGSDRRSSWGLREPLEVF